jgi:hypothetical protein
MVIGIWTLANKINADPCQYGFRSTTLLLLLASFKNSLTLISVVNSAFVSVRIQIHLYISMAVLWIRTYLDADPDVDPDSDFYLMRIRIRFFTLMWIRIRIQIIGSK